MTLRPMRCLLALVLLLVLAACETSSPEDEASPARFDTAVFDSDRFGP